MEPQNDASAPFALIGWGFMVFAIIVLSLLNGASMILVIGGAVAATMLLHDFTYWCERRKRDKEVK